MTKEPGVEGQPSSGATEPDTEGQPNGTATEPDTEPDTEQVPASGAPDDPLADPEARRREANADSDFPLGRPGRPFTRMSPFVLGFTGALGALLAWFLLQALVGVRQVLVLIVVAMFLAIGLNPAVEAIERRGLGRRLAVAIVYLSLLGCCVGLIFAIAQPLTEQIYSFINRIPEYVNQLQNNPTISRIDQRFQLLERAQNFLSINNLERVFGGILGFGRVILGSVFSVITVMVLTLYFLVSLPGIKHTAYQLVPRSRRARVSLLGDEILGRVGGYISGALTIAVLAGTLAFIFLQILGVKYALALALIVALFDLIPIVGATVGATIVSLVGLSESLAVGIACVVFFIAYQQVENYFVYPRVMKRSVNVPPTATITAALIGGALLGVVGALLAIPTAAAIAVVIDQVLMPRQDRR